jgi:hypothetical protein
MPKGGRAEFSVFAIIDAVFPLNIRAENLQAATILLPKHSRALAGAGFADEC